MAAEKKEKVRKSAKEKKNPGMHDVWRARNRKANADKGKQTFNPETKEWER